MKDYIKIVAFGIGLIVTSSMLFSQGVYSGGHNTYGIQIGNGPCQIFTNQLENPIWYGPVLTNIAPIRTVTNMPDIGWYPFYPTTNYMPSRIDTMDELIDHLVSSGRICARKGHIWKPLTTSPETRKCQLCNKIQYKKEIWE